jgi:hypothetical protein
MQRIVIVIMIIAIMTVSACSIETKDIVTPEKIVSDCPFGNIDCEYPGNCGRYIDVNLNNICDHSE